MAYIIGKHSKFIPFLIELYVEMTEEEVTGEDDEL